MASDDIPILRTAPLMQSEVPGLQLKQQEANMIT